MNCNTTHYRANSSSVPGDPTFSELAESAQGRNAGEYGGNWRASTYLRGSAGRAEPITPPSILLNEIVANTDSTNGPSNDWIELYNPTEDPITLGPGWYLSDDGAALTKWQIPTNTVIEAHSWVSFDEVTGFHNPTNIGFGLSKSGEQVFLSCLRGTAQDRVVDALSFKAQESNRSLGRYPDGAPFWFALTPTRDAANAAPSPDVVISEIMYHPPDLGTNDNARDEFIELWNGSDHAVALSGPSGNWRLNGEVDFTFTALTLEPGEYALAVNFDPLTNAVQLAAFESRYGVAYPYLIIVGPYSGKLANSSGRVALEKPQAPDVTGGAVSWNVVDEVIYADGPPWPCGSDGTGNSLHRLHAAGHGSDPSNWTADRPSAGASRPAPALDAPTITAPPSSRIVPTNTTLTFAVGACGPPPFAYQWQFENEAIPGATNATWTLCNAQLADSGRYRVQVSNDAGAAMSDIATLIVQIPPVIVTQPQSMAVLAHTTPSLSVAVDGTPPLRYQWRFNGVDLPGQTNSTLVLTNIQLSQAGAYSTRVFNTTGSAVSSNAILVVNSPPIITSQPVSVATYPGADAVFSVGATGTGPLAYQWLHNGSAMAGATNSTLVLNNVQLPDDGSYAVVVTNVIGPTASQAAMLSVQVPAAFVAQPCNTTALEGQRVSFNAIATGTPPILFRWIRNGVPFLTNDTGVFTFNAVALTDAGNYCVAVTNLLTSNPGVLGSNFTLTVLADSDRDGLPDSWEQAFALDATNAADALIDSDGDGMINRDEYIAGTNPRDPASYLKLDGVVLLAGTNGFAFQFNAVSNRSYTVQMNSDAAASGWTSLASFGARSTNVTVRFTNAVPFDTGKRFFRLVTPQLP